MRSLLFVVLVIGVVTGGVWLYFGGGAGQVTEFAVRGALVEAGVPEQQAECMAPRMVERLTPEQLNKLRRIQPEEGESAFPQSQGALLERIRRVDDPEAVEVTVRAAAACALGLPL